MDRLLSAPRLAGFRAWRGEETPEAMKNSRLPRVPGQGRTGRPASASGLCWRNERPEGTGRLGTEAPPPRLVRSRERKRSQVQGNKHGSALPCACEHGDEQRWPRWPLL